MGKVVWSSRLYIIRDIIQHIIACDKKAQARAVKVVMLG